MDKQNDLTNIKPETIMEMAIAHVRSYKTYLERLNDDLWSRLQELDEFMETYEEWLDRGTTMNSDPYMDVPPGGEALAEGVCEVCHGVKDGFVAFPGEWPCRCPAVMISSDLDHQIERWQLRKKGL